MMIDQELMIGDDEVNKKDGDTRSEKHRSRALSTNAVEKRNNSVMKQSGD